MLVAEAISTVMARFGIKPLPGEQVRWGLENLDLTAARLEQIGFASLAQPQEVSCDDHAGVHRAWVQQWDGKKWNAVSHPYEAGQTFLRRKAQESATAYAQQKGITPGCRAMWRSLGARLAPAPFLLRGYAMMVMTETQASTAPALLTVNNIEVMYSYVILVLKGVSLLAPEGGIVALLGANGAGKSITLKAVLNLLKAERGEATKGSVTAFGERIDWLTASDLVPRGIIQVMEGRHYFPP